MTMKFRHHSRVKIALLGFVVLIVVARLLAPSFVLRYVNKTLQNIPGYTGHVDDISLHIIRGAYQIHGIHIFKRRSEKHRPFFTADVMDIALQWSQLIHGRVVAAIDLKDPKINYIIGPKQVETKPTGPAKKWQDTVEQLVPLDINRLTIEGGDFAFEDPTHEPAVHAHLNNIMADVTNIRNTTPNDRSLFSTIKLEATAMNSGKLKVHVNMNPLSEPIKAKLNAEITGLNLTDVNPLLKAYGNFDVKKGKMSAFIEAATTEDKIIGYVKPIFSDLEVADYQKVKKEGLGHVIKQSAIGTAARILANQDQNTDAAKIPFAGTFKDLHVDLNAALGSIFQNAFVRTINPGIEHSVNLAQAKRVPKKK